MLHSPHSDPPSSLITSYVAQFTEFRSSPSFLFLYGLAAGPSSLHVTTGSFSSVEHYHESIITKHPLNLKDNDNILFKEGEDFVKHRMWKCWVL